MTFGNPAKIHILKLMAPLQENQILASREVNFSSNELHSS
jgi:hypothetical protein